MKSTILLALVGLATAAPAPLVARTPPNIPSTADAKTQLAGLKVAAQGSQSGYSRDLFPHWITQSGSCNTREVVLKRDGIDVEQNPSSCAATVSHGIS